MRKFQILVIAHSLKNNQIGKAKQIVDESQLTTHPDELVRQGFIKEVFPESEQENSEKSIDDMTIAELKDYAEANEFVLADDLNKKQIVASIKEQIENLNK